MDRQDLTASGRKQRREDTPGDCYGARSRPRSLDKQGFCFRPKAEITTNWDEETKIRVKESLVRYVSFRHDRSLFSLDLVRSSEIGFATIVRRRVF